MGRPIASAFVATFERVPFRRLTLVGRRLTTPPLARDQLGAGRSAGGPHA